MLFVGMLSGTYSSIFIATPVLADLKEREPQYKDLAAKVSRRLAGGGGRGAAGQRARPPPRPTAATAAASRDGRRPTVTGRRPPRRGRRTTRPSRTPGTA